MIRRLCLSAGFVVALTFNTGCQGWCNRWCGNHNPPPAPVYYPAQACVPQCQPAPVACPVGCAPVAPVAAGFARQPGY